MYGENLKHPINSLLTNRLFQMYTNDTRSTIRKLNNCLPQGSVLSSLLFNIYTAYLPGTKSEKLSNAEDLTIALEDQTEEMRKRTLNQLLGVLYEYFRL